MAPYGSRRHPLIRHGKGYLWVCLLTIVFLLMMLSENGVQPGELLHSFRSVEDHNSSLPFTLTPSQHPGTEKPSTSVLGTTKSRPISTKSIKAAKTKPAGPQSTGTERKTTNSGDPSTQNVMASNSQGWKSKDMNKLVFGNASSNLSPEDVVILVKTGATAIWRRLPMHLSTTLGNRSLTPNIEFYSDSPDEIGGYNVIDVLANVSIALKASPDFELYRRIRELRDTNLYLESGSMEGDFYLPGGWRLDKYKFLPLFAHAQTHHPNKKWYIFMEDDNYFFWPTLFTWLSTFSHTDPLVLGSPAARLGEDFAHGGSGFAISHEALSRTFGTVKTLTADWEDYAQEHGCGDHILSHVMNEMGVPRHKALDSTGWAGLQSLPLWRMGFGAWNWCSPIMNIHKVHQADISHLHAFQSRFYAHNSGPLRYQHLFGTLVLPSLLPLRREWDNFASARTHSSSDEPSGGALLSAAAKAKRPWFSATACKAACEEWEECLSWKYADDVCSLSHTAAQGRRVDEGISLTSGWMLERLEGLSKQITCTA